MSAFTTPTESHCTLTRVQAKPRIAYLVSLFPCWSETFIAEELQHLLNNGFDITIFSLKLPSESHVHDLARRLMPRAVYADSYFALFAAHLHFLARKPWMYVRLLGQIFLKSKGSPIQFGKQVATFFLAVYFARTLQHSEITRIHAHWATYPATAAWIVSTLANIPFSFTSHAHDLFHPDGLLEEKMKAADFLVTISEYNRRQLVQLGADWSRVHVVHCGIDTRKFAPAERPPKKNHILAVGRLVPIKGFDVLIEACRILKEHGVDFSCEIVGSGPLAKPLKQQIENNGIGERVDLTGFGSQESIRYKLGESAVFVLPCRQTPNGDRDGIPVVLMEAMAMGVPVVSTQVSGIPELVENGISGILVPPEDPCRLADAIQALLSDGNRCAELAEAGRIAVLQSFDVAKNVRSLERLFTRQT